MNIRYPYWRANEDFEYKGLPYYEGKFYVGTTPSQEQDYAYLQDHKKFKWGGWTYSPNTIVPVKEDKK